MIRDYIYISLKNLIKRKLRSWLTMIGIFIGIAAIVSLIGLGEGLRAAVTSQFGFLGSDVLSVQASGINFAGPPGTAVATPLSDDLAEKIGRIDGVEASINRYLRTATLEFNRRQEIVSLVSMPSKENRKIVEGMLNLEASAGRLLKDGDKAKVFIGSNFQDPEVWGRAGIRTGDAVLLNGIPYEVIGILEKKGSFILDNALVVNEDTLLEDFGDDGTVNVIGVKVKDENAILTVKEDIEKLLRKERDVKKGEEDFEVQSPQNILETLNSTLFAVQLFIYIIASISLLVGGIGIMNTMYTAVLERTKEIGIMKSIGAKNKVIFILFSIESGFLGMVGGIVGVLFGISFAYGLAFLGSLAVGSDLLQARVTPFLVIGSLLFSFLVGLAAGLLPAYQASRMQPVEALRYAK
ncbi:MAG TPA: ABC transporter permease [Candidatus Nanoarchaeia archaeon]|nr:ABC transporter permease [Candidatus Nanoarchaeia archaeon]